MMSTSSTLSSISSCKGSIHLKNPIFPLPKPPNPNTLHFLPPTVSGVSVRQRHSLHSRDAVVAAAAASSGANRVESETPFWISMPKEVIWGLRALIMFLIEQPGQLKYIEWPGFQSTLKTASLTLVLVACLIVALSTVDSALCYLLALMLRKSA